MSEQTRVSFIFDQDAAGALGPEKMAALEGQVIPVAWNEPGEAPQEAAGLIEKVDQTGQQVKVTMLVSVPADFLGNFRELEDGDT